jgi:hypothetical protein
LYCSNVFVITVLGKGATKKDPLDFILVASDDSYYQETVTVGVTFFFLSILSIIYPSRLKASWWSAWVVVFLQNGSAVTSMTPREMKKT